MPEEPLQSLETAQSAADAAGEPSTPSSDSPPSDEPAGDTVAPEVDDSTTDSDAEPEDPLEISRWIDATHKTNFAEKYKSDQEAMAAIANLSRTIGQRDADAEYGRQVRQHEAAFREYLAAQQQPQKTAPADPDEPPEWDDRWVTTDTTGKLVPSATAPSDVAERYRRRVEWRDQHFDTTIKRTRELEAQLQAVQNRLDGYQQSVAQTQAQRDTEAWTAQHKDELLINGTPGQPTVVGQRFIEAYEKDLATMPEGPGKWNAALTIARAAVPQPKPTKKLPIRASRQPPVAPGPKTDKAPFELFSGGMSLAEYYDSKETE